ncbi:transposase, partial [Methylobacterium ajmalii]
MLDDAEWRKLEPLIEARRPRAKTPPQDQRRTISAILWRHQSRAKWRAIPAEFGPWARAAQTFVRWTRLGVWERLLRLAQHAGVQLGIPHLREPVRSGSVLRSPDKSRDPRVPLRRRLVVPRHPRKKGHSSFGVDGREAGSKPASSFGVDRR